MLPTKSNGAIRLFRVLGITVFLHWSWFVVAVWQVQSGWTQYENFAWRIAEYLALFAIVLLHEFGHSLACRSVGGRADQIVLWPLGGVAYVAPPQRPGAVLWSIAAGPLVNVALIPITFALVWFSNDVMHWPDLQPDRALFIYTIFRINLLLLCFNILPIYPLDGGQILQALLWFFMGQVNSLKVASVIGILGGAALLVWAFTENSTWMMIMSGFVMLQAYSGYQRARELAAWLKEQRTQGNGV